MKRCNGKKNTNRGKNIEEKYRGKELKKLKYIYIYSTKNIYSENNIKNRDIIEKIDSGKKI